MIVAGIGFRSEASVEAILGAIAAARRAAGFTDAGEAVGMLATPFSKASAPVVAEVARRLGVVIVAVDSQRLASVATATRSARSLAVAGTGSVAEASALAAAGPGARLLAPRAISACRTATAALAATRETNV
ncbi:MAG: precorrin methylase [Rhizobiales bacterium]|nr:precorrin methylase [Hyphomicrobiales bacterium]